MALHLAAAFASPAALAGLFAARVPPPHISLRMNDGLHSGTSPAAAGLPSTDSSTLNIAPQLFAGQELVHQKEQRGSAPPALPFPVEVKPETLEWSGRSVVAETLSSSPHIVLLRSLLSPQECAHLKQLAEEEGMARALIHRAGEHELTESSKRTNSQTWLRLHQDSVVGEVEERIARLSGTCAEQGEPLQVLRYEPGQQFARHFDFYDPITDPPEKFEAGGNRLATIVMCLAEAEEGGETEFDQVGVRFKLAAGDGLLWRNLHPHCDGADPHSLDRRTSHAGRRVERGEKWVATKWIHERSRLAPPSLTRPPPPPPHFACVSAVHDGHHHWRRFLRCCCCCSWCASKIPPSARPASACWRHIDVATWKLEPAQL